MFLPNHQEIRQTSGIEDDGIFFETKYKWTIRK